MPMPDYKAQCPIAVIIPVLFLAHKEAIVVVAKDDIAVVRDRDALQRVSSGFSAPHFSAAGSKSCRSLANDFSVRTVRCKIYIVHLSK